MDKLVSVNTKLAKIPLMGRMHTLSYRLFFLLLLCAPATSNADTVYKLTRAVGSEGSLDLTVDRPEGSPSTTLELRGARFGIPIRPQVTNVSCDGRELASPVLGSWNVPDGCRHLSWTVPMDVPSGIDANEQRSLRSPDGSFCLFTEAASLPRLTNTSLPELLYLSPDLGKETIPKRGPNGTIALPSDDSPPLYALLGAKVTQQRSAGGIELSYYLDDPEMVARLPSIDLEFRGLKWLAGLAPAARDLRFSYVWQGLSPETHTAGGSTGDGLILVNYLRGQPSEPLKAIAIEVTPLIEATHQLGLAYGTRPQWVEESLATYFGISAFLHVSSTVASRKLMSKWQAEGAQYSFGLLDAQRRVAQGEQSAYGAYFTKGVAFWNAIDVAMRDAGNKDGLASRLHQIWKAAYDTSGRPPQNFGALIGLSKQQWRSISREFLER